MTSNPKPLSKYPFIKARECVKSLYLHYWKSSLASPPDNDQLLRYNVGNKVGVIGREIFPNGIDLSENNQVWGEKLLENTRLAMRSKQSSFYEAAFTSDCLQFICQVDLLKREKDKNVIIEVKSCTEYSFPEHLLDIGFQYKILKEALPDKPLEIHLAFLNKKYIRQGQLDINKLFTIVDMTKKAKEVQPIIEKYIDIFSKVINGELPNEVEIGEQCFKPHKCFFFEHCWKNVPSYSVWNLSKIRKSKAKSLYQAGFVLPGELPLDVSLSEMQLIEVEAAKNGSPVINHKKLQMFINQLEVNKPLYYMDFETMMPAAPLYDNTSCYQHLCFQYSIIYKNCDKKLVRREFLAEYGMDPRQKFIKQLLSDTEEPGNIIVYNKNFECSRLREFAKLFPDLKDKIENRISRIQDLMIPFKEHYYYHPAFEGKFSLKTVLPLSSSSEAQAPWRGTRMWERQLLG